MYILAIDTSGREGSVALARGDAASFEVMELRPLAGGVYSAELVPRIAEVLKARALENKDIGLFAVCSGPGSFTGLRVGLSAVKALAEVLSQPIVASTVLEAICVNAGAQESTAGTTISVLDAQRGEVFSGEYRVNDLPAERVAETLSSFEDFAVWLSGRSLMPPVYTPDAAIASKLDAAGLKAHEVARPTAESYARIGLKKFLAGQTVAAEDLDADYIRRSDAEIFSGAKK